MFSFQSLGWHWDGGQGGPFSILHISSFSIQWQVIAVHFPNVLQNRRCLLEISILWNVQFEFTLIAISACQLFLHSWGDSQIHQFTFFPLTLDPPQCLCQVLLV